MPFAYVFVQTAFDVINFLIIIRVLLSWLRPNTFAPGINFIYQITEPILAPFRSLLPSGGIGVDFSPLLALLVFRFLRQTILGLLL